MASANTNSQQVVVVPQSKMNFYQQPARLSLFNEDGSPYTVNSDSGAQDQIVFLVTSRGAKGDGVTDDTAAIQATIDAAEAAMGGTSVGYGTSFMSLAIVYFPPGVYLCSGLNINNGRIHLTGNGARLKASAAGRMVTFKGRSVRISNLFFDGNGVAKGAEGIYSTSSNAFHLHDLKFQDFAGRAIFLDTDPLGNGNVSSTSNGNMDNIFAMNCLLNTAVLTRHTGVIEMNGSDCTLMNSEIGSSRDAAGMSSGGFAGALVVRGGNTWVGPAVQLETSDFGMYVDSPNTASCKFIGVRADLNQGHGFIVAGGIGLFSDCHSYRNGKAATFTYHGFNVTGGQFEFDNCIAEGVGQQMLVGFKDTQNSAASRNSYKNCRSFLHSLRAFDFANVGPMFTLPNSAWLTAPVNTASIKLDQITDLRFANTVAFSVTAFTDAANGQLIRMYGDGFTTIVPSATIITNTGTNLLLASGRIYQFIKQNGIYYHI